MKIFVVHSSSYNFQRELYQPLKNSCLNKEHEIKFPQEKGYETITRDTIKNSDLVVAEVSHPSTGEGIELGWANIFDVPIVCIYKKEKGSASKSLNKITSNFIIYKSTEDMIHKLERFISNFKT